MSDDVKTASVVRVETGEIVASDYGAQAVVSVPQALRRIRELQDFIAKVMVKGEDYAVIPGTKKPSLLKPGAEKLCEMYGLAPQFEEVDRERDWTEPFFFSEVKCRLMSKRTGEFVTEGIGSANSREKRYTSEKVDQFALANTILKMAKKRALVDATLSATRSSGILTQDVEDLGLAPEEGHRPAHAQQGTAAQEAAPSMPSNAATPAQVRAIYGIGRTEHNRSEAEVDERSVALYGAKPAELSRKQASEFITSLQPRRQRAEGTGNE